MPDRAPSDRVRAASPIRVGSVTLLPIERMVVRAERGTLGAGWVLGAKEPYALIVREAESLRVVAVAAAQVSLEQLRVEIAGLDAVLAAL